MAAITGSKTHRTDSTRIRAVSWWRAWTPMASTAAIIVAVASVLGPLWVGLVVAGLFLAGNGLVMLEGRELGTDEFAAISTLHAAAAAVLALSL